MEEVIRLFNRRRVRYLLIGGPAPRGAGDIAFLERKKKAGWL